MALAAFAYYMLIGRLLCLPCGGARNGSLTAALSNL